MIMSKKILVYPLLLSIIFHYTFLYSDRIYNHLFLVLTNTEKKELSVIDENIYKLKEIKKQNNNFFQNNEKDDNISDLIEHFQEEKEKYLNKISEQRSSSKSNKQNQGSKPGVAMNGIDTQFGKFAGKSAIQVSKDIVPIGDNSFKISIIPRSAIPPESTKCEASYYGIGMILGPNFVVRSISDYSNVAKEIHIKKGDYLLGFKNSDNKFYEGNSLIPLIQKNYKNEKLTIIWKQDGKLVENSIVLDSICYEKAKRNQI
jgi:hypothetical protein